MKRKQVLGFPKKAVSFYLNSDDVSKLQQIFNIRCELPKEVPYIRYRSKEYEGSTLHIFMDYIDKNHASVCVQQRFQTQGKYTIQISPTFPGVDLAKKRFAKLIISEEGIISFKEDPFLITLSK